LIIIILLVVWRCAFAVFSLLSLDKFPKAFCIQPTLAIIWL